MALMEASTGSSPAVKFDDLGDGVIGAVIEIPTLPVTDFQTGVVQVHQSGAKAGQPKEQERISLIALGPIGNATVGKDRGQIVQGDEVTVWSAGMKRKAFFDTLDEVRVLNPGDIYSIVQHEVEEKGKGLNDLKLYQVVIRPPDPANPNEMAVSAAAIEEHEARQHRVALATGGAAAAQELEPDF